MDKSILLERLQEVENNFSQAYAQCKLIEGSRNEILLLIKKLEELEKEQKPV